MSSYDCVAVSQITPSETRHIGQVIKGLYSEWYESFVRVGEEQRLACISLVRPTTRQLTGSEAATFLADSFTVGAPNASPAERGAAAPEPARPDDVEPADVQPEPLKRLRQPVASDGPTLNSGAERAAGTADLPPLPAGKDFSAPETNASPNPDRERASSLPATVEKSTAIGIDDREQVTTNQAFPWNTLAYLSISYPNGGNYRCSAVLVSPYSALTAGHCVHNKNRGGYVSTARIYPGQTQAILGDDNPIRPFGSKADVASVQTTAQWAQISGEETYVITEYRHDLGAVQYSAPFTHTSTFMPVLYGSTGSSITSAGYPAEVQSKDAYGIYADTGNETNRSILTYRSSHLREFAVDASGGNSGGPFFYTDPGTGQRYLVGLLSYAEDLDDQAGGPWYDSWNQTLVSGWVSWTPGSANAAATVSGLRVASVYGSAHPVMLSYLRFYNSGSSAGTVDVTLADHLTGMALATWRSPNLPGGSSRQFSIEEIENSASATFAKSQIYSISVLPTFSGNFQNILWRKLDATVTNISTCDTQTGNQSALINVHSSLLESGYPSQVIVHNTGSGTISPTLGVFNAQNGQRLGTYATGPIQPNGQKVVDVSALETAAGISANGVFHYNIRSDGTYTGYLQHLMTNKAAGIVTDMTATCRLAP